MTDIGKLRPHIFGKFKSISDFARVCGMSKHVVYNIMNQVKNPDSEEISRMGKALGLNSRQVDDIFLHIESPIGA